MTATFLKGAAATFAALAATGVVLVFLAGNVSLQRSVSSSVGGPATLATERPDVLLTMGLVAVAVGALVGLIWRGGVLRAVWLTLAFVAGLLLAAVGLVPVLIGELEPRDWLVIVTVISGFGITPAAYFIGLVAGGWLSDLRRRAA